MNFDAAIHRGRAKLQEELDFYKVVENVLVEVNDSFKQNGIAWFFKLTCLGDIHYVALCKDDKESKVIEFNKEKSALVDYYTGHWYNTKHLVESYFFTKLEKTSFWR